jgi:hypothetical protein
MNEAAFHEFVRGFIAVAHDGSWPDPVVLPSANDGCLRLNSGPWQATCTDRTMNGLRAREQDATSCIFSKRTRAAVIAIAFSIRQRAFPIAS